MQRAAQQIGAREPCLAKAIAALGPAGLRCRSMKRLSAVHHHLSPPLVAQQLAVTPAAVAVSPPPPQLLSDEQVLRFVATGFLSLPLAATGDELHAHVHARCEQLGIEGEHSAPPNQRQCNRQTPPGEDPGAFVPPFEVYNVHPRIAGMAEVLDGPVLRGALLSILGEDCALNAHRSVAFGSSSVSTHKDTQRWPVIVHRIRTVYIFYLPAGAALEMCPTAIIPQSHWLSRDQGADNAGPGADWSTVAADPTNLAPGLWEHMCEAPAHQGTAVLLHSAIFHRGTLPPLRVVSSSVGELPTRPMIKLIYHRTRAPTAPTWAHRSGFADDEGGTLLSARLLANVGCTVPTLAPAIESVWRWLLGGLHTGTFDATASSAELEEELVASAEMLMERQRDGDEALRLGTGYKIARVVSSSDGSVIARTAQRLLLEVLARGSEAGKRVAVQALGSAGEPVVPPLLHALRELCGFHPGFHPHEREDDEQFYEGVSNTATALGEAASDSSITTASAAVKVLVAVSSAVRNHQISGQQVISSSRSSTNPFGPRPGRSGALASIIVALDHIGQRAVAITATEKEHDGQADVVPLAPALRLCLELVDHLLLHVCGESGEHDLLRGGDSQDSGRALSKRECVLSAEAIRNLCLLGPMLCAHRPALAPALFRLSSSLTTSYRLRGAVLEALSRLTAATVATAHGAGLLQLASLRNTVVQRLVEGRWVSDGGRDPHGRRR